MRRQLGVITALTLLGASGFAQEGGYWTLLTDFLYVERYTSQDQKLAVSTPRCLNCSSKTELDVGDLASFGFEPGIHVALSYVQNPTSSYEAGFLYVWDWENTKTRTSKPGDLSVPFKDPTFVSQFSQVNELQAYYKSRFYTAELNYSKVFSRRRDSFLAFSGIGGFRFANLDEKFSMTAFDNSNFAEYDIKTYNDLIGLQLGFLFQINAVKNFHWDLMGKAGVGLNRISVQTFLGDQNNTIQLRNFTKQAWQSNIFAEASAGFGYRALPCMDIRAGYEMLYFCGLALAPDQMDTSSRRTDLHVKRNGYVIVYGLYAGFVFSF